MSSRDPSNFQDGHQQPTACVHESPCITIPAAIMSMRNSIVELNALSDTLIEGNVPRERVEPDSMLGQEPPLQVVLREAPEEIRYMAEQVAQLTAKIRGTLFDA